MWIMTKERKIRRNHTLVIAEAGVNHNGNVEMAKELIDVAAEAGADIVKFQTFKAEKVISKYAPKAEYQKKSTAESESQLDMVRRLELDESMYSILIQHCKHKDIEFLSTPFDFESIELLSKDLNLSRLKIPSGEITNGPYLLEIAKTGKPVILSTGMSTLSEVETALGVLAFGYLSNVGEASLEKFQDAYCSEKGRDILINNVTLLHCTTEYPAPFDEVNLKAMTTLQNAFKLPVGLSDHTPGIVVSLAAVALGATVIEKHFTLDKNLPGPDHTASLDPYELSSMVSAIRIIETALGDGRKIPSPSELKNKKIARRSLVSVESIRKGDIFSQKNLSMKRPGTGMSPMHYWSLLGKQSANEYSEDELIKI